ncbi:MAG: hypothetical protein AAGK92_08240 [Pseudomonadota bacterium]
MRDWQHFDHDPGLARWATAADKSAADVLADPAQAHQYRYCRTWFVGVDALPNALDGSVRGVPLAGNVLEGLWQGTWHSAQVSVTFPGYPQRMEGETEGQHQFRARRDAAHVDGLLPMGPARRRHLIEPHAFILGLPLNDVPESPLVVWEGSAAIMHAAFSEAFKNVPASEWSTMDVTEIYQEARKRCFETCTRVALVAKPGEALLLHRLTLHGVAPWAGSEPCDEGRRIAYFRPLLEDPADWLAQP